MDKLEESVKETRQRLGANIRYLRKSRRLTQKYLSSMAKISCQTLSTIESGKSTTSLDKLVRIADALNVPAASLLEKDYTRNRPIDRLNYIFRYLREYQQMAREFGVTDIFQDNGGKILQVLTITDLEDIPGRGGNDARDALGNEYELKTVNIKLSSSFTTHHHMNPRIIAKYRKVDWLFAVYEDIELKEIYLLKPHHLESYYADWEKRWYDKGGKDINNPKIPLGHVKKYGIPMYREPANRAFYCTPMTDFL